MLSKILEGITLLDFKLYYKVIIIKTILYWHINRHIAKQIIEIIINLLLYSQLMYDQDAKVHDGES